MDAHKDQSSDATCDEHPTVTEDSTNGELDEVEDGEELDKADEDSTDDEIDTDKDPWPWNVGPALQVLSIDIYKPDHSDSRVRGEITITDRNMNNNKYYIYKGSDKDSLKLGWNRLLLTRGPVASVIGGNVKFQLTSDEDQIFNHEYDMNKATENSVERTFTLECDGNSGYRCKMVFVKTPFATVAKVAGIFLLAPSPPYPGKEFYQLHGKISVNTVVCFDTKREEALEGMYQDNAPERFRDHITSIPFYNTLYAVPLDSPLTIDVDLSCDGLVIFKRRFERNACVGTKYLCFKCDSGGFLFRMELQWQIPYHFFNYDVQVLSHPRSGQFSKIFGLIVSGALVEVFSVFFGRGSSAAPCDIDLYGAIAINDGDKHFNILAGRKDCPGKWPSSSENDGQQFRTLPLKWPGDWWVDGENFCFNFKLKDEKNNLLCVGISSWMPGNSSRYDIRLCDAYKVEGEDGYLVAVNYSVFENGKKAKVYVECSNGPYSIYGTVFTQYNNYDYSSTYEKQCYRSMLFKRSEEVPLLTKRLQIPLLKSQVSAPADCDKLIVCVDLWVRPLGASVPHKRFTFNTNETESCDMIWGRLTAKVEWISG